MNHKLKNSKILTITSIPHTINQTQILKLIIKQNPIQKLIKNPIKESLLHQVISNLMEISKVTKILHLVLLKIIKRLT
jgi:hypothetical protein